VTLAQVQKLNTQAEIEQTEFEAIKTHLETYITSSAPIPTPKSTKSKQPSRHISHLTQMAARALGRDVPGMMGMSRGKRADGMLEKGKEKAAWDDLAEYGAKASWKGLPDLRMEDDRAGLEMVWGQAWAGEGHGQSKYVQRIQGHAPETQELTPRQISFA
jgi:dynactin-4